MKEIQIFKTELDTLIDKLIGEEVTSRKNIKLSKLNDICKSIVNKGAVPTIQGVVKIMNEEGFVISARTIYNVRENGNAYRELLDGWIKANRQNQLQKRITNLKTIFFKIQIWSRSETWW
jgi:hypothetical protein